MTLENYIPRRVGTTWVPDFSQASTSSVSFNLWTPKGDWLIEFETIVEEFELERSQVYLVFKAPLNIHNKPAAYVLNSDKFGNLMLHLMDETTVDPVRDMTTATALTVLPKAIPDGQMRTIAMSFSKDTGFLTLSVDGRISHPCKIDLTDKDSVFLGRWLKTTDLHLLGFLRGTVSGLRAFDYEDPADSRIYDITIDSPLTLVPARPDLFPNLYPGAEFWSDLIFGSTLPDSWLQRRPAGLGLIQGPPHIHGQGYYEYTLLPGTTEPQDVVWTTSGVHFPTTYNLRHSEDNKYYNTLLINLEEGKHLDTLFAISTTIPNGRTIHKVVADTSVVQSAESDTVPKIAIGCVGPNLRKTTEGTIRITRNPLSPNDRLQLNAAFTKIDPRRTSRANYKFIVESSDKPGKQITVTQSPTGRPAEVALEELINSTPVINKSNSTILTVRLEVSSLFSNMTFVEEQIYVDKSILFRAISVDIDWPDDYLWEDDDSWRDLPAPKVTDYKRYRR